jgi:hypothetical protein
MTQENDMQTLLHGTCACAADNLIENGSTKTLFLTDCESVAEYYAECAHDECACGDHTTLKVDVNPSLLTVDYAAYEEPLSFYRNEWAATDREWAQGLDEGTIPYPTSHSDVTTALSATRSVKHNANIPKENIQRF